MWANTARSNCWRCRKNIRSRHLDGQIARRRVSDRRLLGACAVCGFARPRLSRNDFRWHATRLRRRTEGARSHPERKSRRQRAECGRILQDQTAGAVAKTSDLGISMAKSLGGGFPIGAFWVRAPYADLLGPGSHATTFGGTPLACAVALRVLEVIQSENLADNARNVGEYCKIKLLALSQKHPISASRWPNRSAAGFRSAPFGCVRRMRICSAPALTQRLSVARHSPAPSH